MKGLNAYQLKWIAIIGMVLSHMVYAWHEIMPLWLMIPLMASGGLTFPIMGYFVVEGYRHTSNLKQYFFRLFVFGLIATLFYPLVFRAVQFNIMFSIMLCLVMFLLYDKLNGRFWFWLIFPLFLVVALFFDWWLFGVIMLLLYYLIRNENIRRVVPALVGGGLFALFALWGLFQIRPLLAMPGGAEIAVEMLGAMGSMDFMISSVCMIFGVLAAAYMLRHYNGERGKQAKWLFYVAYPLHLAVLGGIALALGLVDFSVYLNLFGFFIG